MDTDFDPDPSVARLQRARGRAVEKYAEVETSLSKLFAFLLGAEEELAGFAFFKISNARSRNKSIESLLAKEIGTTYDNYWHGIPNTRNKGMFTLIQKLDETRNQIVHWTTVISFQDGERDFHLAPHHLWFYAGDTKRLSWKEIDEFSLRVWFISSSIDQFVHFTSGELEKSLRLLPPEFQGAIQIWHDIFRQPAIYPPPEDHPLSLTRRERGIQLQSSRK